LGKKFPKGFFMKKNLFSMHICIRKPIKKEVRQMSSDTVTAIGERVMKMLEAYKEEFSHSPETR